MAAEFDLRIVNGDLAFGPDDEPLFLAGADAIAQDVKHRLVASGLTAELVADDEDLSATLGRIVSKVEEDERIKPGTAKATVTTPGTIAVTARTMDGTPVSA